MDESINDENIQNENSSIPEPLRNVENLLNIITKTLEDYTMECKSELSKKQWESISNQYISENCPVLISRKYFIEVPLDDAFQNLIFLQKSFSDHLQNFIKLLQSPHSSNADDQVDNTPNHRLNFTMPNLTANNNEMINFLSQKSLDVKYAEPTKANDDKFIQIHNAFADLIKTKINFDLRFLRFEAVLHKSTKVEPSKPVTCLCQICSNISNLIGNTKKKIRGDNLRKQKQHLNKIMKRKSSSKSMKNKKLNKLLI